MRCAMAFTFSQTALPDRRDEHRIGAALEDFVLTDGIAGIDGSHHVSPWKPPNGGTSFSAAFVASISPVAQLPQSHIAWSCRFASVTNYSGRMFAACLPLGPAVTSKDTVCASLSVLKPLP